MDEAPGRRRGDGRLPAAPRRGPLSVPPDVEDLLRELAPQVLGVLVRRYGDFDAAEDAVQEALLAAAEHWPAEGIPRPAAGLADPDRRAGKLIDQLRSERRGRRREDAARAGRAAGRGRDRTGTTRCPAVPVLPPGADPGLGDRADAARGRRPDHRRDRARVPGAGGRRWPSGSAGRSSGSRPPGVPFRLPTARSGPSGCASVLHVLYLIFNEGYASSSGADLHRTDLSGEAIRLARMVHAGCCPTTPRSTGLLALMLLTDARRPARTGAGGELIPLAEQDRGALGPGADRRGDGAAGRARWRAGAVGEYQLQAAIAAVHDRAARAEDTDWPQILALYGLLERMTGNPMVTLNRAVAAAMVHGPAAGLTLLSRGRGPAGRPAPARRGAGPPVRDGRGHRPRRPSTTRRGGPHHQPPGARPPVPAGRPAPGIRPRLRGVARAGGPRPARAPAPGSTGGRRQT